jgi:hypothetical protein
MDALAAGVGVRQFDSRIFRVVAGQEVLISVLEDVVCDGKASADARASAARTLDGMYAKYAVNLEKIGGTPIVRKRVGIAPEEKPKAADDPWSEI